MAEFRDSASAITDLLTETDRLLLSTCTTCRTRHPEDLLNSPHPRLGSGSNEGRLAPYILGSFTTQDIFTLIPTATEASCIMVPTGKVWEIQISVTYHGELLGPGWHLTSLPPDFSL